MWANPPAAKFRRRILFCSLTLLPWAPSAWAIINNCRFDAFPNDEGPWGNLESPAHIDPARNIEYLIAQTAVYSLMGELESSSHLLEEVDGLMITENAKLAPDFIKNIEPRIAKAKLELRRIAVANMDQSFTAVQAGFDPTVLVSDIDQVERVFRDQPLYIDDLKKILKGVVYDQALQRPENYGLYLDLYLKIGSHATDAGLARSAYLGALEHAVNRALAAEPDLGVHLDIERYLRVAVESGVENNLSLSAADILKVRQLKALLPSDYFPKAQARYEKFWREWMRVNDSSWASPSDLNKPIEFLSRHLFNKDLPLEKIPQQARAHLVKKVHQVDEIRLTQEIDFLQKFRKKLLAGEKNEAMLIEAIARHKKLREHRYFEIYTEDFFYEPYFSEEQKDLRYDQRNRLALGWVELEHMLDLDLR